MIESLKTIVGEKNISSKASDLKAYSYDQSDIKAEPASVIWPANADEIRRILVVCNRMNIPVIPRGLGTSMTGATIGENALIMDLTRLNKLFKFDPYQKEVDVEPGIVLSSLNNYLAKEGYEFPIMPYCTRYATLGGMAATNTLAPKSFKLGRMDEWIKEIEYLDGTGKYYVLRNGLKRVVGKEGCTGIITRMRLRITEAINTSLTIISYTNLPEMFSKLSRLQKEYDVLAIDYLSKPSSAYVGLDYENHLLIEYLSDKGEVRHDDQVKALIRKRESIYNIVRPKGYYYIEDAKGTFEQLFDLLSWSEKNDLPIFGPIGMNTLLFMFKKDDEDLQGEFYTMCRQSGINIGYMYGYGLQRKSFVNPEFRRELIKLKEEYDYNNILNRGKILDFR